jgi:hypothetical protein
VLDVVGGQQHALVSLLLGMNPFAHFAGGWLDTRISLDKCGVEKIGYFAASGFRKQSPEKLVYVYLIFRGLF